MSFREISLPHELAHPVNLVCVVSGNKERGMRRKIYLIVHLTRACHDVSDLGTDNDSTEQAHLVTAYDDLPFVHRQGARPRAARRRTGWNTIRRGDGTRSCSRWRAVPRSGPCFLL